MNLFESEKQIQEVIHNNVDENGEMTQEELVDTVGYCLMRTAELEMLFQVLVDKKIISKSDFKPLTKKFTEKSKKKLSKLVKRKNDLKLFGK